MVTVETENTKRLRRYRCFQSNPEQLKEKQLLVVSSLRVKPNWSALGMGVGLEVGIYVCIRTHICIYKCVYENIHIYTHIYRHMYVYIFVSLSQS